MTKEATFNEWTRTEITKRLQEVAGELQEIKGKVHYWEGKSNQAEETLQLLEARKTRDEGIINTSS